MRFVLFAAVLAGTCLSSLVAWEIRGTMPVDAAVPQLPVQDTPSPRHADGSEPVQLWAATVLERPLFRKDRRPEPSADAQAGHSGPQARLTGVLIAPSGRRLIFKASESAKSIVAEEGTRVGDFVVRLIEPGRAVVEANGELRVLTLSVAEEKVARRR
jgi:hypothetical protein